MAVIGAGGLGGQIILLLARLGIGRLKVIDFDCFDETNLNRQALSTLEAVGRSKAEQAAETIRAFNPGVRVDSRQTRIDSANAETLLSGADLIMDALDNIPDRFLIEALAKKLAIPLVHGAVAGFEGQIMTIFPQDEGLKLIYGTRSEERGPAGRPEFVFGVPVLTPALIATYQAMEAVKILLNKGTTFRNRMIHFDLESGRVQEIRFRE
jgi:molybdopterin/thiamine biosynthesis adenylyltransferase